jgi:nicotinamidase-related amidase
MHNNAIIIVDMLNDFISKDGSLYVPGSEKLIPRIRNIVDVAHKIGTQVVYVCDSHSNDDPEFKSWPKHCVSGTHGAKIIEELNPERQGGGKNFYPGTNNPPDLIIEKNKLSALSSFHFRCWLNEWTLLSQELNAPTDIYIVGVATEYCILSLVKDLRKEYKYRVSVVSDCIAGVDLKPGDTVEAINEIGRLANFVRSDNLVNSLKARNIDIYGNLPKQLYDEWRL